MRKLFILVATLGCGALMNSAACSSNDNTGTGGAGGMGGTYGTGGKGGTTGGTSGTGGTGGKGGSGGSGTGGTAGTGGSATGGTAGTGGSAGTAGSAGDGGVTKAQVVTCPATAAATLTVASPSVGMYAFSPTTLTISAGGVIKFNNPTTVPHTFTSGTVTAGIPAPDGTWDTGSVAPNNSACVKINVAGTYPFYCAFHPTMMTGTATVQ